MTIQHPIPALEDIWRAYDSMEARLSAPLSERMLDLAGIGPGKRVLDLATGRGEPAIRAAHRVAPNGYVLGVDPAHSMLAMARERATREGVTHLELRVLDATRLEGVPTSYFDAALMRWGLMFVDRPVAALRAARRAMVPSSPLVIAVWAAPERAPFFALPRRVLAPYRPLPPIDPEAPGMFRYADPERLRRDLEDAGFRVVHQEEIDVPVMELETVAEVITYTRAFGLTRLLNDLPEEAQRAWEESFAKEVEAFRDGSVIRLGGVTRVVVASS
jgi:ubiquinone/menaquinone biosynthesis C-methylase UbiE